eukprot:PhM_4_TR1296/c0_g1_i1/m.58182
MGLSDPLNHGMRHDCWGRESVALEREHGVVFGVRISSAAACRRDCQPNSITAGTLDGAKEVGTQTATVGVDKTFHVLDRGACFDEHGAVNAGVKPRREAVAFDLLDKQLSLHVLAGESGFGLRSVLRHDAEVDVRREIDEGTRSITFEYVVERTGARPAGNLVDACLETGDRLRGGRGLQSKSLALGMVLVHALSVRMTMTAEDRTSRASGHSNALFGVAQGFLVRALGAHLLVVLVAHQTCLAGVRSCGRCVGHSDYAGLDAGEIILLLNVIGKSGPNPRDEEDESRENEDRCDNERHGALLLAAVLGDGVLELTLRLNGFNLVDDSSDFLSGLRHEEHAANNGNVVESGVNEYRVEDTCGDQAIDEVEHAEHNIATINESTLDELTAEVHVVDGRDEEGKTVHAPDTEVDDGVLDVERALVLVNRKNVLHGIVPLRGVEVRPLLGLLRLDLLCLTAVAHHEAVVEGPEEEDDETETDHDEAEVVRLVEDHAEPHTKRAEGAHEHRDGVEENALRVLEVVEADVVHLALADDLRVAGAEDEEEELHATAPRLAHRLPRELREERGEGHDAGVCDELQNELLKAHLAIVVVEDEAEGQEGELRSKEDHDDAGHGEEPSERQHEHVGVHKLHCPQESRDGLRGLDLLQSHGRARRTLSEVLDLPFALTVRDGHNLTFLLHEVHSRCAQTLGLHHREVVLGALRADAGLNLLARPDLVRGGRLGIVDIIIVVIIVVVYIFFVVVFFVIVFLVVVFFVVFVFFVVVCHFWRLQRRRLWGDDL